MTGNTTSSSVRREPTSLSWWVTQWLNGDIFNIKHIYYDAAFEYIIELSGFIVHGRLKWKAKHLRDFNLFPCDQTAVILIWWIIKVEVEWYPCVAQTCCLCRTAHSLSKQIRNESLFWVFYVTQVLYNVKQLFLHPGQNLHRSHLGSHPNMHLSHELSEFSEIVIAICVIGALKNMQHE